MNDVLVGVPHFCQRVEEDVAETLRRARGTGPMRRSMNTVATRGKFARSNQEGAYRWYALEADVRIVHRLTEHTRRIAQMMHTPLAVRKQDTAHANLSSRMIERLASRSPNETHSG